MDIKILKDLIKKDKASKQGKYVGRELYYYKPQKDTIISTMQNGIIHDIPQEGDSVYVNFFKLLVTQKIDYILSNPVTADERLINYNIDVDDLLDQAIFNASLDSTSWLYLYVDKNSKLQWTLVPDAQIIPIYDEFNKSLISVIRYYPAQNNVIKVEIWTANEVIFYSMSDDSISESEVKPHYTLTTIYNGQVEDEQPKSFGMIPFIPLFNNKDHTSDAEDISSLIEVYNSICSGFVSNIDKFQEAIIKLKGFTGDSEEMKEMLDNIKKHKAAGTPADGDIEYLSIDIPTQARDLLLTVLKDAIYALGRGCDTTKIGDGNITNVVIRSRYQSLDFKANDTEKRVRVFYNHLIDFLNNYYNTKIDNTFKLNKSLLCNETEQIAACTASIGLISQESILNNHPWVKDAKYEMRQLEKEKIDVDKKESDML